MVLVTVNITEENNKNLRIYMAENDLIDKRIAINEVLEKHFTNN